jgi:hypothetical protein
MGGFDVHQPILEVERTGATKNQNPLARLGVNVETGQFPRQALYSSMGLRKRFVLPQTDEVHAGRLAHDHRH